MSCLPQKWYLGRRRRVSCDIAFDEQGVTGVGWNMAWGKLNVIITIIVKDYYTDISLLLGKYTRTFVPRFPEITEMLYFPTPSALPGNRGTNVLVYFPRSNEITVMLHFTRENAWKIDPKFLGQHNTSRFSGRQWIKSHVPSSARHYFKAMFFQSWKFQRSI